MNVDVTRNPTEDDLRLLSHGLRSYNSQHIGHAATEEDVRFAVFARNGSGKIIGGIRAIAFWDWLHIELLWLEEDARGSGAGRQLLFAAEDFAMKHGFFHSRLETTSFQARKFYEKHGYDVFGELRDLPKGFTSYFMKKALV